MTDLVNLEDRIAARISAIMPNSFAIVAAVGDLDAMKKAANKFPACFVIFEGEQYPEGSLTFDNVIQSGTMRWQVFVMARSMRGPKAGRKGPGGSYDLSDDVREVLRGFDPVQNVANGGHPMTMIAREHSEDPDAAKYVMLMRFAHEVDG